MEKIYINTYFEEVIVETSNLKNMVILKNFTSNIVEEAIIILKQSSKVKKIQKIQKIEEIQEENNKKTKGREKEYIVKEAEMLVNQYISKLEKQQKDKKESQKFKTKYFKLKKFTLLLSILSIVELIAFILCII